MACMSGVIFWVFREIGDALTWNEARDVGAAREWRA